MFVARARMSFGKRRRAFDRTEIRLARDQDVESFVADRAVSARRVGLTRSAKSEDEHSRILISRSATSKYVRQSDT